MRIITGISKGTKLETLEGLETRPTAERVKEAVFSILQFELAGKNVLDLFAGSGQLGLEALSRGAEKCCFIENNPEAMEIVRRNAKKTRLYEKCRISNLDYKVFLRSCKEKFDIVFLDPPYRMKILPELLDTLTKKDMLNPSAYIVCESEDDVEYGCDGLETVRHNKYGKIYITVLRKTEE